jgi:uncharacterized membrane protein YbhN (UPF0104 family)
LLLWLAVRHIDWQTLSRNQLALQPLWLVLAWITMNCANLMATGRWGYLMRSLGLHQSWWNYISLYFAGGLINQGLPSTIGGDSYRAIEGSRVTTGSRASVAMPSLSQELHEPVDLHQAPPRMRLGFLAVTLDRGLGLIGNNILGALGLILGGAILGPWAQVLGWWALAAMLGGAALACTLLVLRRSTALIHKMLLRLGMPSALSGLRMAFGWPAVGPQLILAATTHTMGMLAFWCCLKAFGATAPLQALMIGLPALGLLMMLPISISGWGLREATLSATLTLWGIDPGVTVLASVCFGLVTVITYLPGAFSLLRRRNKVDPHAAL